MNGASCSNCYYSENGECTLQMAEKEENSDFCYHWIPKKDGMSELNRPL